MLSPNIQSQHSPPLRICQTTRQSTSIHLTLQRVSRRANRQIAGFLSFRRLCHYSTMNSYLSAKTLCITLMRTILCAPLLCTLSIPSTRLFVLALLSPGWSSASQSPQHTRPAAISCFIGSGLLAAVRLVVSGLSCSFVAASSGSLFLWLPFLIFRPCRRL